MKYYVKLGINLAIVCAVAAAGLSLTYSLTKDAIKKQDILKQENANKSVMTEADKFTPLLKKPKGEVAQIFSAKKGSQQLGFVALIQTRGYGGIMELVVGVDISGKVTGIGIVNHRETPGLGAGIEDIKWQKQFIGKTADEKLEINKNIDSLTGATISSKAVAKAVTEALASVKGR